MLFSVESFSSEIVQRVWVKSRAMHTYHVHALFIDAFYCLLFGMCFGVEAKIKLENTMGAIKSVRDMVFCTNESCRRCAKSDHPFQRLLRMYRHSSEYRELCPTASDSIESYDQVHCIPPPITPRVMLDTYDTLCYTFCMSASGTHTGDWELNFMHAFAVACSD